MDINYIINQECISPHFPVYYNDLFSGFVKEFNLKSDLSKFDKLYLLIICGGYSEYIIKKRKGCSHLSINDLNIIRHIGYNLYNKIPTDIKKVPHSIICYDVEHPYFIFAVTYLDNYKESNVEKPKQIKCSLLIDLSNYSAIERAKIITNLQ